MNWPDQFDTASLQRLMDAQAILRFEQGGLPLIREWQALQGNALLTWLRQNTPWWAERLPQGARWKDLESLPVVTRQELMSMYATHGAAPVPRHHGELRSGSTSGSSGRPVKFYVSQLAQRIIDSHYFADHRRQGRNTYLLRAVIDSRTPEHEGPHILAPAAIEAGSGPILRRRNRQFNWEQHLAWLVEYQPAYLAINIDWLCGMLEEGRRHNWPMPRIQQILAYGSTVSAAQRQQIRDDLGASVRDRYSCEECGPLAFQCPHSDLHYHVSVLNSHIEVVDDNNVSLPEGRIGRVLVTGLHQYATPLIRYDIGDVAALHNKCPGCGEAVPTLSHLLGRRISLIRTADGELVYVNPLSRDWLSAAKITEYRLIQTTLTDMTAEVVMPHPMTAEEEASILAMLKRTILAPLQFQVKQVDVIHRTPSEKRQDVVSLVR